MQNNPTGAAAEGMPPLQNALSQIEGPLMRALKLAKVSRLLADVRGDDGTAEFKEECAQGMVFLSDEIFAQLDKIEDLWLKLWNDDGDQNHAEQAR